MYRWMRRAARRTDLIERDAANLSLRASGAGDIWPLFLFDRAGSRVGEDNIHVG